MADAGLVKKLGIKAGQRMVVINAPEGYLARLEPLPDGTTRTDTAVGTFDLVHLFVHDTAGVARDGPTALQALIPGGLLWVAYPKQTSGIKTDINRDTGWDVINEAGYRAVSLVSIDEVWSAIRFRPIEQVTSRRGAQKRGA